MKFPNKEIEICVNLFLDHKTTSEVQEYLMAKYNMKRSSTSNFVKFIRKYMGIYDSLKCQVSSAGRASH